MMNHRLITAGLAAGGGLLTAAFLQAALALADANEVAGPSADGADAFTIGGYTFDPFSNFTGADVEGFSLVHPLTSAPPLLTLGGGNVLGTTTAPQDFAVYNADGTELGSINSSVVVTNLAGFTNTEFTVTDVTAADGASAADLPTEGAVYDVFNFGGGFANIYTAVPGADGANATITDTFVTPFGSMDLSSLFAGIDASAPLQPGDAFAALHTGASGGGDDAFAIGGYTLDPFTGSGDSVQEGFASIPALGGAAPFLSIGGASILDPTNLGNDLANQSFTVYDSTGASLGTLTTGVDVTNLLGMTNTQLIVATPLGVPTEDGLPATGTVYDVFNFGGGFANVYIATPGEHGTVTDTLVTPFGNMDLSSLFADVNVAGQLDPGAAFTGLQAGTVAGGEQAFAIGSTTFDPFTGSGADTVEGYGPVYQTIGSPPLLNIGGGTPGLPLGGMWFGLPIAPQDFNIYNGTGANAELLGTVNAQETVTQLLGLTNTSFVVGEVTPADGVDAVNLPAIGSVYDVFNFGGGFVNIYTAIPGLDGAVATVTDTFVTPFGDFDLSSLFGGFDASALLDPGDAFLGW
ncbi:hypothetical protein [Mycolicibacter sinensis]|uniref:PE-PGRS family protein n=1 Tax=Mycolicibacter sinensis (strain JDM601) TaxID=875328 RepID=A0A1A3TL52_MYCSD|nr:hypothetical protein [Mycolicibacter sinensis]OBK83410.1 hypothetical protein A5648_12360 [Mycolicibacter sinensis]